jgi:hypothetical protein
VRGRCEEGVRKVRERCEEVRSLRRDKKLGEGREVGGHERC